VNIASFSWLQAGMICAASVLASPQQARVDSASNAKNIEVDVKTDKVEYSSGEPIRYTVLLLNKGSSPVYIAKNFYASGGGIAGFSLSVKQTEGKSSAECPLYVDRFSDTAGPRSAKQILIEDFLSLAPGGVVGYTGKYQGCAVKHEGSYQLTATYCPCDLNTGTAQTAAREQGTQIITNSIRSKPWTFRLQAKERR
jgi:hypothetical protein